MDGAPKLLRGPVESAMLVKVYEMPGAARGSASVISKNSQRAREKSIIARRPPERIAIGQTGQWDAGDFSSPPDRWETNSRGDFENCRPEPATDRSNESPAVISTTWPGIDGLPEA